MVKDLNDAFEKHDIDMSIFKPNQFAALSVFHAQFLTQVTTKTKHWLNRRFCCGFKQYVPGNKIERTQVFDESSSEYVSVTPHEHLASQCLPKHYDDSAVAPPAGLEHSGQAIVSAPIVCELCHKGFSGVDTFMNHCKREHKGFAEYRKRTIYKAREAGMQPLLPWLKRQMAQSFQFFRFFCAPGSQNEWTSKTHSTAVPRREEACAICACKDWLNKRFEVYLFKEATGTTTWARHLRYADNDEELFGEEHGEDPRKSSDFQPAQGGLLVEESGAFCVAPKDKIHKILNVERYIKKWPLIPQAELHASSVQHPDDNSMRWLLHSRRVERKLPQLATSNAAQSDESLPPSAGIGDKDSSVWMCKSCIDHLCTKHPKMPPLALADCMFLGRHHPLFRNATLATRMLASSARLIARQLFLGRGADDEVHKGTTGNTMLISQPGPSYEQVLPNTAALQEGLVVLFCKSTDDVSKAQILIVNREEYRAMVQHRKEVCPVFATTVIDTAAIDNLPENAVPDILIQGATHMPEVEKVKTTMHGPASRMHMFSRQEPDADKGIDVESDSCGEENTSAETPEQNDTTPADPDSAGGVSQTCGTTPDAPGSDKHCAPEALNEHETIVAVDEESLPQTSKLFEALKTNLETLTAEGAKYAQAHMKEQSGGEVAEASAQKTAIKELLSSTIAVNLQDIARQMSKNKAARAEWERLVAAQEDTEPTALAVPTGRPLSIFDSTALPAAYTEFLFGDCVPFLKRETPVSCQQIFDALPRREELEYSLPEDAEPYQASSRSRFDSPEFYAVFATFLRTLKLFQSVRGAVDRPGFYQDIKAIASSTSNEFVQAALHESRPQNNSDLMFTAGSERVRIAIRHLTFSTATVPLTDGYKMRCHHLGTAMKLVFGPLTVFHTHNYADNYSPEILTMYGCDPHMSRGKQNITMPTLQQMHKNTAGSPRSTAALFLLMQELTYRHLYRVDRTRLGNFNLSSAASYQDREDDLASNGFCGMAAFASATFGCNESQQRGFAHSHGKVHSVPDGSTGLNDSLAKVVGEILKLEKASGDEPTADEDIVAVVEREKQSYNARLISSASTRQYESATLPARQMGQDVRDAPFSEKQQRQSRYDGGLEEDGTTERPLVPVVPDELPAHIARELRRTDLAQQPRRNAYREVPLTGCQLCIAPRYLFPQNFGQKDLLGEEGEVEDDNDGAPLPGLPWVFNNTGELKHLLADLQGNVATDEDKLLDAQNFEQNYARDVRFLHNHCHNHECSFTCIKNQKNKSKEQQADQLKSHRTPPCRFDFFHVVILKILIDKLTKIRRRGKDIVVTPSIVCATARNQFGLVALERPQPFRGASSDVGLATMRCNNDFRYMPRGFPADVQALVESFRCDVEQLAACFQKLKHVIKKYKVVAQMAVSIVALHVAATIVDFYITKYAAKPMEQLQNLTTQYALGRLIRPLKAV